MFSNYDCNPHIQESPHPRAPKSPKNLKELFPGLPARSVKKVSKKSLNTDFVVVLTLFRVISHFFDTFLTLWAGTPRNTFLRLFGISGPQALDTPVYGGSNRNFRIQNVMTLKRMVLWRSSPVFVGKLSEPKMCHK